MSIDETTPVSKESVAERGRKAKEVRKGLLPAWTQGSKMKVGRNSFSLHLHGGGEDCPARCPVKVETWFRKGNGFAVMGRGIVRLGKTRDEAVGALAYALGGVESEEWTRERG